MKFRALITETTAMRDFMNIALSLSKFSKGCVMRITARKVYFIISEEEAGPRRPLVWCELPVNFYFKEYNVVGVNDQYNEIYLEISTVGEIPTMTDRDEEDEGTENIHSTIDIKKFLMFLSGLQINNTRTVCSIVHEKMVKLNMEQPGALSIQIFFN
ncbi:hypothetical protein NQ314_011068 [Rhamnusium bicolor]|uniref:Uncharacterized protein n=1 Tax=Rhamnusium bicolor TaxID=1586634 RepID=A0AAV8XNM7_9CUCU|nr:hypothetical protein NQ314_011068 [Rhamnusium bicolor]